MLICRGVVPSIASTIIYNLPYGGPVSMIWGWALSAFLILFIGLAMVGSSAHLDAKESLCRLSDIQGELASSMPTSAGLYFWSHRLAPPEYRNFLAWFVGCKYSPAPLPRAPYCLSFTAVLALMSKTTRSLAMWPPSRPWPGHAPASFSPLPLSMTPTLKYPSTPNSGYTSASSSFAASFARTARPSLPDCRRRR